MSHYYNITLTVDLKDVPVEERTTVAAKLMTDAIESLRNIDIAEASVERV